MVPRLARRADHVPQPKVMASHHGMGSSHSTQGRSPHEPWNQHLLCLPQASSKDTGQLYAALHHRILALRSRVEQEQEAKTPAPEPGAAPSNEDYSDDDDVLAPSGATAGGEPVVPALGGARGLVS